VAVVALVHFMELVVVVVLAASQTAGLVVVDLVEMVVL
jgi:hypothetical protein